MPIYNGSSNQSGNKQYLFDLSVEETTPIEGEECSVTDLQLRCVQSYAIMAASSLSLSQPLKRRLCDRYAMLSIFGGIAQAILVYIGIVRPPTQPCFCQHFG